MANGRSSNFLFTIVVVALIVVGAYYFLYGKDHRSGGQKFGDAVDSLTDTGSLSRAGEQLKDKSPAEKLGDSIKDKGEELKR